MSLRLVHSADSPGVLSHAKLHLLPGRPLRLDGFPKELYQQSYEFWKSQWGAVFEKSGDINYLNPDNFLRQDLVCVIRADSRIAGLVCFSFFRLEYGSTKESGYLRKLPQEALETIAGLRHGLLMTFEYLCVGEDFRKKTGGASVAEILTGLGTKVMAEYGVRAAVGTAVRTYGMDVMAARFGFANIANVEKFGLDCAVVMNLQETIKSEVGRETSELIKRLWNTRIDDTTFAYSDDAGRKAA